MPDLQVKLDVKAWHIGNFENDFDDWTELCKWCADREGMSCTMIVRARNLEDGYSVQFQVEGETYATVLPRPNSWVLFNGYVFEVLSEEEYKEKFGK